MSHVTAYLTTKGAADAIDFYARAFGATESYRLEFEGRVGHAEIVIGETTIMLSDEYAEYGAIAPVTLGGTTVALVLEVPDCEAVFQQAIDAGATLDRPMKDEPYGRGGWLIDPFGHRWNVATMTPDWDPSKMS
ncbi:hypothetical protein AYO38_09385 [bacterium SCGC AG-212-C10]|nr:hypothetical protein AYO38_09385 [bacterium SCGC AG-212-C10]